MLYSNSKRVDLERMTAEVLSLKDRVLGYQETVKSLQNSLKSAEQAKVRQKETYETALAEKDTIIKELKNKLAHALAAVKRNGTNTGISTAATPVSYTHLVD